MIDSPMLLDAWLWLTLVVKGWLFASVCLLFFLVSTQRSEKPTKKRKSPPNHPGLGGGLHLPG